MARRGPPPPLEPDRAWDYLLTLLTRRDYTVDELRRRLNRRGVAPAAADELLARLERLELVDDAAFAERWVTQRKRSRGRIALRTELRRKGVAEELVERETAELDAGQQAAAAVALLQRFAWRYRPEPPPTDPTPEQRDAWHRSKARAFAFLARRGFGAEAAGAALEATGWWREA